MSPAQRILLRRGWLLRCLVAGGMSGRWLGEPGGWRRLWPCLMILWLRLGCMTSATAPQLVETGFHPLDGARFLRSVDVDERVVSLVAYHSCARIEAEVRGLGAQLAAEFSPGDPALADALLYCDMTTGPDGDYVRPADRLVEIRGRYGPGHEVTRFVELAAPEILATAGRVEELLAVQPR